MGVTWRQIMAFRLQRHHLHRRVPPDQMLDVAAAIGGLQAQLMSSAELSLWARVEGLEPDALRRALWEERTLVKTWAMRGTLHLLPAGELRMWQEVPQLDRRYLRPAWLRYFELTVEDLERLTAAVGTTLHGRLLTREQLAEEVSALVGSSVLGAKLLHSWGAMLKPAAFQCLLCFAPNVGQNVRFTSPATWLGDLPEVDREEAEHAVTRRFLAAFGPTTREVFGQWLGVHAARAGRLIRALGEDVMEVDVEGMPAWLLRGDEETLAAAAVNGSVRLLPAFDQYVLAASRHAASLLPGPHRDRIYRPQGWLSPVLLVDGRMDGIWKHERKGKRLVVRIEPFVTLPARARRQAEEEAERLAAFLGGTLEVVWEVS